MSAAPELWDARGNRYLVATPEMLRALGVKLPATPAAAALSRAGWAAAALAAAGAETVSDGLLLGPFQATAPFDLLIVNTDGSLAERSGNGLTIFAQALTEADLASHAPFTCRVHHDKPGTPTDTRITPATHDDAPGFWIDMGTPAFGPAATNARHGTAADTLAALVAIDPAWRHTTLVRLGNPHAVTLLPDAAQLPDMATLHARFAALAAIAFANGPGPFPDGINLQFAAPIGRNRLAARIFERGEGPTESSGTSATAVACAARHRGLLVDGLTWIVMPGGVAPIRLSKHGAELFGVARKIEHARPAETPPPGS